MTREYWQLCLAAFLFRQSSFLACAWRACSHAASLLAAFVFSCEGVCRNGEVHKHQVDVYGRWLRQAEYTAPSEGDWDNPFMLRVDQKVSRSAAAMMGPGAAQLLARCCMLRNVVGAYCLLLVLLEQLGVVLSRPGHYQVKRSGIAAQQSNRIGP